MNYQTQDKNQSLFRLTSLNLAAFLITNGFRLIGIERTPGQKRASFLFTNSTDKEKFLNAYNFSPDDSPDVMVDARKYASAVKQLKDRLYQE
jgi:hypothetical protein